MPTYTGTAGNDTLTGSSTADTIDGLDGDDTLYGDAGNDVITGGNGTDYIDGGTGADTMSGGLLNDTYVVDSVFDTVIENAAEGDHDLVLSSVNIMLSANVEDLTLTGSAVSGAGNALENIIHGNSGDNSLFGDNGEDELYGEGGNDTLYGGSDSSDDLLNGGSGDDIMYGGGGNDAYFVDSLNDVAIEYANEGGNDYYAPSIDWTISATGNIEGMVMQGSANLAGTGNNGANIMIGNTGDNIISGLGGADNLYGGDGNDTIIGGLSNDLLRGQSGYDTFVVLNESSNLATFEADRIYDLDMSNGDRIDMSAVDADVNTGGDQAFTFVASFTGVAGQATATYIGGATDITNFDFDVDGDGLVDYRMRANGDHTGTVTDVLTGSEPISDGGWFL